jgi:hypothetical protein
VHWLLTLLFPLHWNAAVAQPVRNKHHCSQFNTGDRLLFAPADSWCGVHLALARSSSSSSSSRRFLGFFFQSALPASDS